MTESVIPETEDKCGRHYLFTDEECVIVSINMSNILFIFSILK